MASFRKAKTNVVQWETMAVWEPSRNAITSWNGQSWRAHGFQNCCAKAAQGALLSRGAPQPPEPWERGHLVTSRILWVLGEETWCHSLCPAHLSSQESHFLGRAEERSPVLAGAPSPRCSSHVPHQKRRAVNEQSLFSGSCWCWHFWLRACVVTEQICLPQTRKCCVRRHAGTSVNQQSAPMSPHFSQVLFLVSSCILRKSTSNSKEGGGVFWFCFGVVFFGFFRFFLHWRTDKLWCVFALKVHLTFICPCSRIMNGETKEGNCISTWGAQEEKRGSFTRERRAISDYNSLFFRLSFTPG